MSTTLLVIHIGAGSIAVFALLLAFAARKGESWHRRAGRIYSHSMAAALVAALLLALLTTNWMLLAVAVFSAYLVYSGWRCAALRESNLLGIDKIALLLMLITAAAMFALAYTMLAGGDQMGVTVAVFAAIGGGFALRDGLRWQTGWPNGKDRLILHLTRMCGASIATLTAVVVVNVQTEPAYIAWLAPTVVFVPVIVYWTRRVRAGRLAPARKEAAVDKISA